MDLVSVIMSVYNEKEEWLIQAIESIINQTYSNIEYIIVLDNPNMVNLKNVILHYALNYSRIIFIENENNMGLVYSLNRALSIAKGKFIARMDADDISHIDRIERQVEWISRKQCDLVATAMNFIDENSNIIAQSSCYGQTIDGCRESLRYRAILPHPTWLFKRDILLEIGGYKNIKTAEDYDLVCHAQTLGKKMITIPEVLFDYRLRNSGVSIGNAYQQYRTAKLIQKEYKKCLNNGLEYNAQKVLRQTEMIDYEKRYSIYYRSLMLYKHGCSKLKNGNRIYAVFLILMAIIITPSHSIHFINTLKLKSINN